MARIVFVDGVFHGQSSVGQIRLGVTVGVQQRPNFNTDMSEFYGGAFACVKKRRSSSKIYPTQSCKLFQAHHVRTVRKKTAADYLQLSWQRVYKGE